MKTLFNLIKIAIIFILIGGCFFLLINKTFIYDVYKGELMESDGIPINRFMYIVEDEVATRAKFYTFLSNSSLESKKNSYLNTLEKCYGKYYYDKDNNITITNYNVVSSNYYREVELEYVSDNYCSEDYKLSDMWVYEYNNKSSFISGDITEKAMTGLIDKIYNGKKVVDPVISDYKNEYSIKVNCDNNGISYTLIFEDFNDNQIIVKRQMQGKEKFAVYEIEDALNYLKSLERA